MDYAQEWVRNNYYSKRLMLLMYKEKSLIESIFTIVLGVFFAYSMCFQPGFAVLLFCCFLLIFMFVKNLRFGICLILLLRPSFELLKVFGVSLGGRANLNINSLSALAIIVFGVVFLLFNKKKLVVADVPIYFGLMMVMAVPTLLLKKVSFVFFSAEILRQMSFLMLFYLGYHLFGNKKSLTTINRIYLFSFIPFVFFAVKPMLLHGINFYLLMYNTPNEVFEGFRVWHPSGIGLYAMLLIFLPISLYISKGTKEGTKGRVLNLFLIGLILFFLVTSYFRTAWMGFLAGMVGLIFVRQRKGVFVILIGLIIGGALMPFILERINDVSSIFWRLRLWKEIVFSERSVIAEIFGCGYGSIVYYTQNVLRVSVVTVHNTYIKVLYENGIVGLFLFMLIQLSIIKTSFCLIVSNKGKIPFFLPVMVFCMGIALMFGYLTQSIVQPLVVWYFWLYAGILFRFRSDFENDKMENVIEKWY